jgi:uncharacterized protein YcaQ
VRAVWLEPGVAFGSGRQGRLAAELYRLAQFVGCDRVDWANDWLCDPKIQP